jgi:hypothetical protein
LVLLFIPLLLNYILPSLPKFLNNWRKIFNILLIAIDELGVDSIKLNNSIKSIYSHRSSSVYAVHILNGNELCRWINKVNDLFTPPDETEVQVGILLFVNKIQSSWTDCTYLSVIPKIYMLTHAVEFIKKHHALGLYSEVPIESYHAKFNDKYREHHYNVDKNNKEFIVLMLIYFYCTINFFIYSSIANI